MISLNFELKNGINILSIVKKTEKQFEKILHDYLNNNDDKKNVDFYITTTNGFISLPYKILNSSKIIYYNYE